MKRRDFIKTLTIVSSALCLGGFAVPWVKSEEGFFVLKEYAQFRRCLHSLSAYGGTVEDGVFTVSAWKTVAHPFYEKEDEDAYLNWLVAAKEALIKTMKPLCTHLALPPEVLADTGENRQVLAVNLTGTGLQWIDLAGVRVEPLVPRFTPHAE